MATLTTTGAGFNPNTGVGINTATVLTAGDDTLTVTANGHINAAATLTNSSGGTDTLIFNFGGTVTVDQIGAGDLSGWSVIQFVGGATATFVQSIIASAGTVTIRSSNTSTVKLSVVDGGGANYDLSNLTLQNISPISLTAAADTITGTSADDTINVRQGNDLAYGGAGADLFTDTNGNDTFYGGAGDDTISSGSGDDVVFGGADNDNVFGGSGSDLIYGGAGNDIIKGNSNSTDAVADTLYGGDGNDQISSSGGADLIFGDAGNDTLFGGAAAETLSGGAGNDVISGAAGADVLAGGTGNDQFRASGSDFNGDTISDFAIGDTIVVTGTDLSSLNQSAASGTVDLGAGNTLTLTGISGTSGSFGAVFAGGNTTISLNATTVTTGGGGGSGGGPRVETRTQSNGGVTTQTQILSNDSGAEPGTAPIVENTNNNGNVVTASLPASISITSEGPDTAQAPTEASSTLTTAIQGQGTGSSSQLIGTAQSYLDSLGSSATVDVRTITPTLNAGVTTSDPIILTGTSATSQSEAFVIDMRSISGRELQIDNIEFASIIGAATITGGAGANFAVGDENAQFFLAGDGTDTLFAGAGDDTTSGGNDADIIYGNQNNDIVYGNLGSDSLFGGQDNDSAYGGQDVDVVYGNLGQDLIYGNLAADTLYGGQGNDSVFGGQGDDLIYGNLGNDTLVGGLGADVFQFGASGGADQISDFTVGEDLIALPGNVNGSGINTFQDLQVTGTFDALIDLGGGQTITLIGVSPDQLSADSFSFL